MRKALITGVALCLLTACGSGGRGVHVLQSASDGPDEFSVLPTAPLEMPADLSSLPAPTPGDRNLVDPTPKANAIASLGGRPSAALTGGVPSADRALVAAASRHGVPAGVRATVAAEDTALRNRAGRLRGPNLSGRDPYFRIYARQSLDAYAELARLRALGVETPTAPPAP